MDKQPGECSVGGCIIIGEPRGFRYWPGGMPEARGALPGLAICEMHWPTMEAKMANPGWRAVYSVGVLSFRPTGVSPARY